MVKSKPGRIRRRQIDLAELSQNQEYELEHGAPLLRGVCGETFDDNIETFREAWALHGARLTSAWIEMWPGTRPFGFWLCDAPEPRELTTYGRRDTAIATLYGIISTATIPPMQVSELVVLLRHDLLTAKERYMLPIRRRFECEAFGRYKGLWFRDTATERKARHTHFEYAMGAQPVMDCIEGGLLPSEDDADFWVEDADYWKAAG